MSSAKARCSSSLTMALPPNFTTMIWSWKRFSHGSDSIRVAAFSVASAWLGRAGLGVDLVLRVHAAQLAYALFSCT